MLHLRTWLICLLLALTGCATTIETAPTRVEMQQTKTLRIAQEADRQAVAVQKPMQTMFDVEPVEGNVLATILEGFQSAEWLPYENGRAPPVNVAQVTTNPIVTGICPPEGSSVTGVTGTVGNCETPSFYAALQTSLVPGIARGSSTPTYTRATEAYQTDFEGKLNLVPSGAARMQGARYVRNWIQSLISDQSALGAATFTGTTVLNIPTPGTDYTVANFDGNANIAAGDVDVFALTLSGTGTIKFSIADGTFGEGTSGSITLSSTPTRYAFPMVWSSGHASPKRYVYIGRKWQDATGGTSTVITVTNIQYEIVTGQTNQNPSEPVSKGVLSAPYHGAGVDGVKYFSTLNGNTVASNVVTEATGAAITSAAAEAAGGVTAGVVDASGPLGYLAEGARTNLCLQSQTFAHASWVVSGVAAVSEGTTVAPDGTATADTITANAGNANHGLVQGTVAITATTQTHSLYVKKGTASYFYIGATGLTTAQNFVTKVFDLTGAGALGETKLGTTTGTFTAATITLLPNDWYRLSVTGQATDATGLNLIYGIATAASGNTFNTYGQLTFNAAGTETMVLWGAQTETASFASTYTPTTTIAVARNADVLTYASAGNISGTAGSAYAEVTNAIINAAVGTSIVSDASSNRGLLQISGSNTLVFYDGTNFNAGKAITNVSSKVGSTWGGVLGTMFVNGSNSAPTAFTGNFNLGASILVSGSNTGNGFYGTIRNLRIYPVKIPSARLQTITTDAIDWLLPENWAIATNDEQYRIAANGR